MQIKKFHETRIQYVVENSKDMGSLGLCFQSVNVIKLNKSQEISIFLLYVSKYQPRLFLICT
jgi:hypothetical protein